MFPFARRAGYSVVACFRLAEIKFVWMCPNLVLLDLNLPCRDGFEVLTFIRSLQVLRETPVVMFTSSCNSRDEKKALFLGANEYITKPLNLDAMMVLLEGVCARYLPGANAEATRSG